MINKTNKNAFSLIEVLVFVTILALFFVTAAAVVTASLRNMKINEHKIIASHYAEELLEWFRGEKETDWNNFVTSQITNFKQSDPYCFNDQEISWLSVSSCQNTFLDSLYKRKAWFVITETTQNVNVYINVSWQELGQTFTVPLRSTFSIWE